jgi:hypothetical protein
MRNGSILAAALVALALPVPRLAAGDSPPPVADIDPKTGEVPPDAPALQEPDHYPVPPGTPADQALWKDTRDVNARVVQSRWAANGLQWNLHRTGLVTRLEAAAKVSAAASARLADVTKRLLLAQADNYSILMGKWPVDITRVCQYPLNQLTSAMFTGDGPDNRPFLNQARETAATCLEKATAMSVRMERSSAALSALMDEAEKALAPPAGNPGK